MIKYEGQRVFVIPASAADSIMRELEKYLGDAAPIIMERLGAALGESTRATMGWKTGEDALRELPEVAKLGGFSRATVKEGRITMENLPIKIKRGVAEIHSRLPRRPLHTRRRDKRRRPQSRDKGSPTAVPLTLQHTTHTAKYLKTGVHMLMLTKPRGMTSLEIAIIVAIVLVIAVAVGWYLYTTFVASTSAQARLSISSAQVRSKDGNLTLIITNPGPVNVTITQIYLQGSPCGLTQSVTIGVGATASVSVICDSAKGVAPGTMLNGYVITSAGSTFPFNAIVR